MLEILNHTFYFVYETTLEAFWQAPQNIFCLFYQNIILDWYPMRLLQNI